MQIVSRFPVVSSGFGFLLHHTLIGQSTCWCCDQAHHCAHTNWLMCKHSPFWKYCKRKKRRTCPISIPSIPLLNSSRTTNTVSQCWWNWNLHWNRFCNLAHYFSKFSIKLHLKLDILIQRSWAVIIPAAANLGSMSAVSTVVL